jgi:hypothetical protein
MNTATATGVGLGVVALILLLLGLGAWYWRRRGRKGSDQSMEAPPVNRANRSASNATDQKTLVASMPNSPQNALFRQRHDEMAPDVFAKLNGLQDEKFVHGRQESSASAADGRSIATQKVLPMPPTDMPLPPPPVEEKRYAINVNINKSMIFDGIMFAAGNPHHERESSREKMPKYRFEEYLPPVTRTPRLSINQKTGSSKRNSDVELEPYPRDSSSELDASKDNEEDEKDETRIRRKGTLKKLESRPPLLPLPA